MKKVLRVKRNEDFQKIIHAKHSVVCKEFVLYSLKNECKHMRIGFSVSKKIGNAVTRNKIKRQVRQMAQNVFDSSLGYDYVLIVRKPYLDNEFHFNLNKLAKLNQRMNKLVIEKESKNGIQKS